MIIGRSRHACWIALFLLIVAAAQTAHASAPGACFPKSFETSRFTVCRLDTRSQKIRLAWTDAQNVPLRSFRHLAAMLGPDSAKVQFAMNAGMFDEVGKPIGLFTERGVRRVPINMRSGAGNFYLRSNGIFWINRSGGVGITPTAQFAEWQSDPEWATQSGPMLVIGGKLNPDISQDGPSKFVRNGVGVVNAHTAYFAISDEPVSFGRFARLFRDTLNCKEALYLDGFVSSLWAPSVHRNDDDHPLGPLIVVSRQ